MRRALLFIAGAVLLPQLAAAQVATQQQASGAAQQALVPVPVLAHAVKRGDLLVASDFTEDQLPAYRGRDVVGPRDAEGMEAVRNMPAGMPLRAGDVITPRLVHRGEPVTIRYVAGSLTISSNGRALADGGRGDMVRVVTETSRTIDALVDGRNAVRITN
jgi:flagella basal body P-ring formation protein FlgA